MAKKKSKPRLSDLENEVMGIVWEQRLVTADQVRSALTKSPPLADSTVRTILRRLVTKGYAKYRSEGRTYVYSPVVASQNVAVDAVRSIIDRFCDGSVESLLVGMIDREVVSPEKLQELASRVADSKATDEARSAKPKSARSPSGTTKSSRKKKGS